MQRWLQIAWGKFRSWQRVCPEADRLTPEQLRAAWVCWDGMRQAGEAVLAKEDGWADELATRTVELVSDMPAELRPGPAVFSHWLVAKINM